MAYRHMSMFLVGFHGLQGNILKFFIKFGISSQNFSL